MKINRFTSSAILLMASSLDIEIEDSIYGGPYIVYQFVVELNFFNPFRTWDLGLEEPVRETEALINLKRSSPHLA